MRYVRLVASGILFCATIAFSADPDDILRQSIIGTWWGEENVDLPSYLYGEKTYNSDGTASGFIDEWISGQRQRTVFRSTWKIEGGKLISRVVFTNTPEFLPPEEDIVDRIVSIGQEKMVLVAEINGREYARYRKVTK